MMVAVRQSFWRAPSRPMKDELYDWDNLCFVFCVHILAAIYFNPTPIG